MAASRRQMNWGPVSFTPSGGSISTATGVTNCSVATGGSLVKFSGDGDRFPTLTVGDYADPTITVTTADIAWAFAITNGTRGVLAATHKDARLASGGAITFTLSTAVAAGPDASGQHRQIGSATLKFDCESADGTTNPLSYSLA